MDKKFYAAIVGGTFFMGSSFIASKILLQTIPPFSLVGARFFVAAFGTLPLIWLTKQDWKKVSKTDWLKIAIIGLLQTAGTMGLLFLSMLYISASAAAVLLFTNPLWVAALSPVVLKESITAKQILGLIVGIVGVALLIGFKPDVLELKGNLLGLGSALCWASATIFAKKSRVNAPPFVLSAGQMFVGSWVLLAMLFVFQEKTDPSVFSDGKSWFWFLWLAIPSSVGSFGLWYVALARGGAMRASSFLFLAPVFTVVLSVLILKTSVNAQQMVGAALVCLALYVVNSKK
ncbi:MAG: DMT family transporter [Saprospiraceae bacterium]|nr:DMT family transporter [Saprospiraceae bacterium]